jgi:hypothetical protein
MGILSFFFKPAKPLLQLHSGSFSMDRSGRVLVTTLPSSFPPDLIREIGRCVVDTFRDAHTVQLPLEELIVHYPGLSITARELRGGAMVFLNTPASSAPTHKPRTSFL